MFGSLYCGARWQYLLATQILLTLIIMYLQSQVVILLPLSGCEVILQPLPTGVEAMHLYYVPNSSQVWIDCKTPVQNPWTIVPRNGPLLREPNNAMGVYVLNRTNASGIESLFINNTAANNSTTIGCFDNEFNFMFQISLNVFEPLLFLLEVFDRDEYSVDIFWVQVKPVARYELQTFVLMIWSRTNIQSHNLPVNQTHFNFTAPDSAPPCEIYNFSVTATYVGATYTGPDCGVNNQVDGRMLPSLPDIQPLEASLNYSLIKNDSNITLLVSFMEANYCEKYPIDNYTLVIDTLPPEVQIVKQSEGVFMKTSNSLPENMLLTFQILAINNFGTSKTSIVEFYTSDVKMVQVTELDNHDATIRVKCDFITGSDAKGCMVLLYSQFGNFSMNLTKYVNEIAEAVVKVTHPLSCYTEVFGFDIECDGSVGILAIPGNISRILSTKICNATPPKAKDPESVLVLIGWIIALVIVILSIGFIILGIAYVCKCKRSRSRPVEQSTPHVFHKSTLSYAQNIMKKGEDRNVTKQHNEISDKQTEMKTVPVKSKDNCAIIYHTITHCSYTESKDNNECINNTYAELKEEHIYHVLENNRVPRGVEVILPDPDAPELPPPFKPEASTIPIYHDVLDLPTHKAAAK